MSEAKAILNNLSALRYRKGHLKLESVKSAQYLSCGTKNMRQGYTVTDHKATTEVFLIDECIDRHRSLREAITAHAFNHSLGSIAQP